MGVSLTLDAVSGRSTRTGLEVLANLAPPAGSVVVMALGTNDSNSYVKYSEYIDKAMSLVPTARRVIWLTVWRKGPLNEINRAIHDAVLRYPNLAVVDWVETLRSHPEFLDSDNTHYSAAGYKLRAKAVLAAALS
jgi:lysophospholipase L1-like esterase